MGSSLGRRAETLAQAVDALERRGGSGKSEKVRVVAVSPVYESPHMGLEPGDESRYPAHLNLVAQIETTLAPVELLAHIQAVETRLGRQRTVRWGPRTIDIDILLYDGLTFQADVLTLPHPGIARRAFVAVPLADIAPNLRLPSGQIARELAVSEPMRVQTTARYADTLDLARQRERGSNRQDKFPQKS